jgi:hypothetical protein
MLGFEALAKLPLAALPDDAGQELRPDLFIDGDTFYSATVTPGAVTLTPALYTDAEMFYGPTIIQVVFPDLLTDGDTFYSPQVNLTIYPARYDDADTFYTPVITTGEVFLNPDRYDDPDTFYSPLLTIGIAPPLFVDSDIFWQPFVGLGSAPVPYPANICQKSGTKQPPGKLARQWNGIYARCEDFDTRHPQELVRAIRDRQGVPFPRPEAADNFLAAGEVEPADL